MTNPLGRPVRAGAFEHDPDAFNCFRILPKRRCSNPGAEIGIIGMVMDILNWEWEVIDTNRDFGVVNDFGNPDENGTFSGMMGLLADDKIDMGGLSMRITPERMKVAHFTFPIRYFQQVYIINRPPESDFRNFIFASFTTNMWLTILASIIVVSIIRFIIAIFIDIRVGPKTNILSGCVLETYGIMLKQRIAEPTAVSTMILELILIVGMMFIGQHYQTTMNSKLAAPPRSAVPFLHQDQLIDLFEKGDRYPTYYFNLELEGSNNKNHRRLHKYWKTNPVVTHNTEKELIVEMKKGGVFYSTYDVEFVPQAVSSWDRHEGLTVIRDTTGIVSYVAFGFSSNNKKLCQLFNKALLTILPGIPQITLGPGYAHKKDPEDITVQVKRTSLSLKKHLEQLFVIYLVGSAIAIAVFTIEVVFHVIKNKRNS